MSEDLNDMMTREIHVMREVLASMHMEQKAIMQRDCAKLMIIKEIRTELITAMRRLRGLILDKIDHLDHSGECEFTHLKEQIMTLVDKIQSAHKNNSSLTGFIPYQLAAPRKAKVKLITLDPL